MSNNTKLEDLKTSGVGTFGEGLDGKIADRLFKVMPGHDALHAMQQATAMMDCVYKMTLDAGVEGNGQYVWGVHYLSGMAKALIEDVTHGMMTEPVR